MLAFDQDKKQAQPGSTYCSMSALETFASVSLAPSVMP